MKKDNILWKLDYLETKFLKQKPRYPHTKKLLNSRNIKFTKKLPNNTEEAIKLINSLKNEIFLRKLYSGVKKLSKATKGKLVEDEKKIESLIKKSKDSKTLEKSTTKLKFIQALQEDTKFKQLINSRINKLILKNLNIDVSSDVEFIPQEMIDKMKGENMENPNYFYKCHSGIENGYVSTLWNASDLKEISNGVEYSLMLINGDMSYKKLKNDKMEESDASEDESGEDNEHDGISGSESDSEADEESNESVDEDIEIDEDGDFTHLDDLIAASSDEEDEQVTLKEDINYNEVTDEEPSENEEEIDEEEESKSEDDFFESKPKREKTQKKEGKDKKDKKEKKEKTPKLKLPGLNIGFISGDEEESEDELVKEITKPRKNRRGQRARQKIWEQKYGKKAVHVTKQIEKAKSEREVRQSEYEERVKKREAKRILEISKSGANDTPLGDRKDKEKKKIQEIHPSWEAKKLMEEKTKNVKFQGKKVTF